jgi:hypothetical protein
MEEELTMSEVNLEAQTGRVCVVCGRECDTGFGVLGRGQYHLEEVARVLKIDTQQAIDIIGPKSHLDPDDTTIFRTKYPLCEADAAERNVVVFVGWRWDFPEHRE